MRTCRPDVKGEAQVVTPRGESTDAGHRDGLSRSSVETTVMGVERRGQIIPSSSDDQPTSGRSHVAPTKPYTISKALVYQAYKRVRANRGSAGVDRQSLEDFDADLGKTFISFGTVYPREAIIRHRYYV